MLILEDLFLSTEDVSVIISLPRKGFQSNIFMSLVLTLHASRSTVPKMYFLCAPACMHRHNCVVKKFTFQPYGSYSITLFTTLSKYLLLYPWTKKNLVNGFRWKLAKAHCLCVCACISLPWHHTIVVNECHHHTFTLIHL